MLTSGDEESLREDIKEGIQYALFLGKERGRFTEDEIRLDKIRLNKLQYIVNEDRELGLTFGWYKYGPAPEDVKTGNEIKLDPKSNDEISYLEESRLPSRDYMSTEAFAYYFISELGEEFDRIVTAESTKEYLEEFYTKYAPKDRYAARYTDLYVASARLQQVLDRILSDEAWHEDSTHYYYELEKLFAPVISQVSRHEELEHTAEPLREYQRILTSIIAEAGTKEDLSSKQQSFIKNTIRKFYSTIWDFVSQEISLETMRGENITSLRPSVEATVETYRKGSWESELNGISRRRRYFDLDPNREPSEPPGSETKEAQSLDTDLLGGVSRAGSEVIRAAEGGADSE